MSDKEFDLNTHTARLLLDEPFFAAISRRIDKRASNAIPTAGVMVNPAATTSPCPEVSLSSSWSNGTGTKINLT